MKNIRHIIIFLLSFIGLSAKAQKTDAMMQLPPIQRVALIIKHFEGWHSGKGPYIGWGHRIQPGEHLSHNITRQQGDSLLYEDLRKLFNQFKGYGDYALLLTVLSYNVGPAKILGNGKYKPSRLILKIRQGRKDIKQDYLDFCRWKGRVIPSIKKRRWAEFQYLCQVQ